MKNAKIEKLKWDIFRQISNIVEKLEPLKIEKKLLRKIVRMEECRNDKDTSFKSWKKLKGYQSHRFSLKLTRHDAKEWEKTSAFLLKKFQNEARQQKNFSFTKKFHFHTVLQSPLRKTKKQVGTPTNDRVDLFYAIFGHTFGTQIGLGFDKAKMA